MIFLFLFKTLAYVCQYESQFHLIHTIESIQKETSSNFLFSDVKYYAICILKDSITKEKLKMCSECYKRVDFDNKFLTVAKNCNRINIDQFHQFFSLKDSESNYILVIECKYKFVMPIYYKGELFAIDFLKIEKSNSKYLLNQHSLKKLIPYRDLKDIVGIQYLKAENCIISMPLEEYIAKEYSKDKISMYTEAFNNLYTCDIESICKDNDSESSSEDNKIKTISNIYQNFVTRSPQ